MGDTTYGVSTAGYGDGTDSYAYSEYGPAQSYMEESSSPRRNARPKGTGTIFPKDTMYIRQNRQLIELLGIEVSNTYAVCDNESDRDSLTKGKQLWGTVTEESECCQRHMCAPRHDMTLEFRTSKSEKLVLSGHRPCTCCLSTMTLTSGNRKLGELHQPCSSTCGCCPLSIDTYDEKGNTAFTLTGPSGCWVGMCAGCPCRGDFTFEVDGKGKEGSVVNTPNGSCKICCSQADNYDVEFGNLDEDDKLRLFMGAIFIDYLYFQVRNQ